MFYLRDWPIQKITLQDKEYPQELKKIQKPPLALYYRGNLNENENRVAIVGTRRASDYGKEIAFDLADNLSQAGLIVVSGLARGIDTWAAKGALQKNHRTIAVLGTGLDEENFYPQENLNLAKQILEKNGCLISEYPSGTKGANFTFPQRNRIISGLSLAVVVVEAKLESGALITAHWAKQQKRRVFAVPGPVYNSNSQGCHFLIKQGAKLAESANDILNDLGLSLFTSQQPTATSPEEQLIFKILEQGALDIDKIIEKTKLPAQIISVNLSMMEIENKVKNLGGNTYALTR
ncbi:DNA-protecting protein DprA [bacterium (Candidatus Gribaldobacteria) CG08_land_8_20_14_0_20_39_15]|uniref:DNA-protecting protein DprA n=1 Tax=bacterium (Candidatus Gribaldobacteria) CG08_land_8_20_14_0_20_39_15 TaxID=2014273 RepID=A0A2M6XUP7_9BACT|nr:MAG: DNA-protecting protein DprA [bacterium (Candidatus Gribaldobacteria) CG08_land_8_20_14_0_20_39_15]